MGKAIVTIVRHQIGRKQSIGICTVQDQCGNELLRLYSLERGWRNNQRSVSCISVGKYPLVLEFSAKFQTELWEIKNVPNRSECKFHSANYWNQLNGCVSLGLDQADINGDGLLDNTSSRKAMAKFHEVMSKFSSAELRVINNRI